MRLGRARQLFEARTGNVSDVAFQVGYKNLAHFSKSFAKEFGVSPSEFLTAQEQKV
jgi:AraC-like DNA-binding protein